MAYTQDKHLHALEVTDLGKRGRDITERFFNGTKPEYPRRMRCIQGSDAHRVNGTVDKNGKPVHLGVGDRVTEVALPERSFAALLEMFQGSDFSRTRAYNPSRQPVDYIQLAREEGASLVQAFHEILPKKGDKLHEIVADVCAFANTNGGTIYVGISADKKKPPEGIANPHEAIETLHNEINRLLTPALNVEIDTQETMGRTVIRIQVPSGSDRPYAIEDNKIYVRDEAETSLAVRDEIVTLVKQSLSLHEPPPAAPAAPPRGHETEAAPASPPASATGESASSIEAPRAGVEIIGVETRGDTRYYTMRDLRNGNIVKNVTRSSARRLWHYAIKQKESNPIRMDKVQWSGDIGLWQRYERQGEVRYDLVQRSNGQTRIYYGVSDSGMQGPWQVFLTPEEED
jgi:hypothetical protein